jgi:hypothetical protein
MTNFNSNMVFKATFSEIELASDVQSFVSFNSDSCDNPELKQTILSSLGDDLLKVTKSIASPIKIIHVEKVTDELLEKAL